jgi:hypothetical protein
MNANEIREKISKSNLGFLQGKEGTEYELTKETKGSTHGADLKGGFISCLVGSVTLPVGTKGLLFVSPKIHYSSYVWVDDMQLPAKGAEVIQTGAYYSFCTVIELESGNRVLVDCFKSTTTDPKVIGRV